jgi:hypothetical protein
MQILANTYNEQLAIYREEPGEAKALLNVGEAKHAQHYNHEEHAALTVTCLGILNLDQSLTRE